MPYDLAALERGYGECVAEFEGHAITLRYRVDLDGRALHAIRRALVGAKIIGSEQRIPDAELVFSELVRLLLPCGPEIPEDERGWDITRDGAPIPVTIDELERLPPQLPILLLMALFSDVQNPNRRRPSLATSKARADSPPTPSPTGTASSVTPNGQDSTPPSSQDSEPLRVIGGAGLTGYGA